MGERKSFLIRIDAELLDRLRGWSEDEFRSLNGQIEYCLRRALIESGRLKENAHPGATSGSDEELDIRPRGTGS